MGQLTISMAIFNSYVSLPEGSGTPTFNFWCHCLKMSKVSIKSWSVDDQWWFGFGFSYVKMTNISMGSHWVHPLNFFGLRCCDAQGTPETPKSQPDPSSAGGRCLAGAGMVISIHIGLSKQSPFWWHILKFSSCFIIFVASKTHTHTHGWWF